MPERMQPRNRVKFSLSTNGKTNSAYYYVEGDMVTVEVVTEDATVVEKTTQIGAYAALTARMLLRELVREGKVQEPGC